MMMTFGEMIVFLGLSLRDIIIVLLLYCLKLTTHRWCVLLLVVRLYRTTFSLYALVLLGILYLSSSRSERIVFVENVENGRG